MKTREEYDEQYEKERREWQEKWNREKCGTCKHWVKAGNKCLKFPKMTRAQDHRRFPPEKDGCINGWEGKE